VKDVLTVSILFLRGWRVRVHGSGYARTERKDLTEPFYGGLVPRNAQVSTNRRALPDRRQPGNYPETVI